MFYRKTATVNSEYHGKHINTMCVCVGGGGMRPFNVNQVVPLCSEELNGWCFHCNQTHHPLALLELQRSELFLCNSATATREHLYPSHTGKEKPK